MLYTIENETLRVTASTRGAELQSVYHKSAAWEALWQGDAKYWCDRSPNLFPFVARLNGGKYRYHGKTYTLPLHGFLPTAETVLEERTDYSMTFLLEDTDAFREQYPFRFRLLITYSLSGDMLSVTYRLKNRGENEMVFGLGGHPGFRIPFADGTVFEDYALEFPEPCSPVRVLFDENILRTGQTVPFPLEGGRRLPLRHELFGHDAVVLQGAGRSVRFVTDKSPRFIEVAYPDMPQAGFWQAQNTDAPYVCVEPWATLPARADAVTDFDTSDELLRLSPDGEYRNAFTVRIAF